MQSKGAPGAGEFLRRAQAEPKSPWARKTMIVSFLSLPSPASWADSARFGERFYFNWIVNRITVRGSV